MLLAYVRHYTQNAYFYYCALLLRQPGRYRPVRMYRCERLVLSLLVLIGARFLRSSPRPVAVVEKSPAITGSKVAQRLLLEAYRFQAMTSTDAVDVDEHFPGNHRVKVSVSTSVLS